jgi:hypothetical protein
MTPDFTIFTARLREFIHSFSAGDDDKRLNSPTTDKPESPRVVSCGFNNLALELFGLQFAANAAFRKICEARGANPKSIEHWSQIPAVPTSVFKELELTCLSPSQRAVVFHSSGTTEQRPSRHFHSAESLAIYEESLWPWFAAHAISNYEFQTSNLELLILTPPPMVTPHSSLVHMFEIVRGKLIAPESAFVGKIGDDNSWTLNFEATVAGLNSKAKTPNPKLILGTAFSFVHLLDFLVGKNLQVNLPPGSRVMETGGYKGRSRSLPKAELHALITERLGVPASHIVCEYGMSELSSQAYDRTIHNSQFTIHNLERRFHFPPWVRTQIISPETNHEVAVGETGLLRIFDLTNVFSVMAIQTEDLAVRRGEGFELIGRAELAEPRGCSLMAT